MSEFTQVAFAIAGYRVFTIAVGLVFAYLGYKLFCKGIYEQSGNLEASWGKYTLIMRQGAPGIFFALFGVIVISISLYKGIDIERIKLQPLGVRNASGIPLYLPGWYFSGIDRTKDVQVIIQKVINGQSLTADEQTNLKKWYQKTILEIERFHFEAKEDIPPWYKERKG